MGEAYIVRRGGTGGLNFRVVGGTARPASPKENDIWVNSSTAVHAWDFSSSEPYRRSKNKNLIVHPYYFGTVSNVNGIAYTVNSDGTVTANGTATADAWFRLHHNNAKSSLLELDPGTYTLNGCPDTSGNSRIVLYVSYDNGASWTNFERSDTGPKTFALTQKVLAHMSIIVLNGKKVSNAVFKPQLEKGSSATSFVKGDASGQAWIETGTSSSVDFNALKKNGMQTYPVSCKQYSNGVWNSVNAHIYRGSEWKQFSATFAATIKVTYPAGSTVTCTNGSITLTATTTTGSYTFTVPSAGTWTVKATSGSANASVTVNITANGESKTASLSYQVYIIKDGNVDVDKYPYKYTQQYWDSSSSSNRTRTGGVDSKYIKFEQEYEGKLAVWTESTNGNWQKNEFSNVVVPQSASVFYFQYYRLSVYQTAKIQVGSASVSVARDGAATASRYNETVSIDITALRGQTVTFSYTTYGQSGHQDCYVGNAWFE